MQNQRKRVWVDGFQTKLLCRIGVYWLIYTLSLFNLLFAWRLIANRSSDLRTQFLATLYDNVPLFLAFVFAIPWIACDAIRFTNRLVGPLSRFRETIRHMTNNKPVRPIILRQGDFLREMQDDFNALLASLQQRGAVDLERADNADGSGT